MNRIKVLPLINPNTGRSVNNQWKISTPEGVFFQSYDSIIAFVGNDGRVVLDPKYWNYSKTTSKWRNIFLGESKAETMKKIESEKYKFQDLNN